jgi:hypothetical protein
MTPPRVFDRVALEVRTRKRIGGSNPSLFAITVYRTAKLRDALSSIRCKRY